MFLHGCHDTGKIGNLEVLFFQTGKTRGICQNVKYMFYRKHGENLKEKNNELVILSKKSSHLLLNKCYDFFCHS